MRRVLLVEDEKGIADTLLYALQTDGFEATWCTLAQDALQLLRQEHIDIVVLDVGLPDISGFEACKQLRRFSDVPVIFLTARGDEVDRIVGLEIGADDYVVKPFSPREVVTRIRTILRRTAVRHAMTSASAFQLDERRAEIRYHGVALELTRYEYGLLKTLVCEPGRVFSRQELMDAAWQHPDVSLDRTIDTHIKQLRAKLRSVNGKPAPIRTHRGLGYSLASGNST